MVFLNLDHPIRWIFLAHALAGTLALFAMAIPLISKKGSKLHVRAGWVYIAAMTFVSVSAFGITPWRVLFDLTRDSETIRFAVFLSYIAFFTICSMIFGVQALRAKNRKDATRSLQYTFVPAATLIAGIATQVYGLHQEDYLLMLFPFVGHGNAAQHLFYWMTAPKERMHWWYAHMNGMFAACIATVTAFLVTALPRLMPGMNSPLLWFAPGLILGTWLNRWTAKYRRKFEA